MKEIPAGLKLQHVIDWMESISQEQRRCECLEKNDMVALYDKQLVILEEYKEILENVQK